MSQPFIAEIRMSPYNFAPRGWAFCNGQLLPISQNTALFALVGTMYGGNGTTNFGLPNLQGRTPLHFGQGPGLSNYVQGQSGGASTVTLNLTQIPVHTHTTSADSGNGGDASPAGQTWGVVGRGGDPPYSASGNNATMNAQALTSVGGSLPHNNESPYLTVNFIIALQGVFPNRN